jgi:hypothetical protein
MNLTIHLHLASKLRLCEAIPLFLLYILMVWYFVKHRDNFTLYINLFVYL